MTARRAFTGTVVTIARALADAISDLLGNPAMARRRGQAGRERVEREFQQETVWNEMIGLYRKLLRERGLPMPIASSPEREICLQKQ